VGHGDYHPAAGRAMGHGLDIKGIDPRSSILGGEAFLSRIYDAYRGMQSSTGANVWNTTLLIGWDEPGGTDDHVPPPSVPPPDPAAPAGECNFTFDRSGYRVPAIVIPPWVAEGEVFNQEHRHTSLIATLREQWNLGDPFTGRDAVARSFSHVFTLDSPRDPKSWPVPEPRPVPKFTEDALALGQAVSVLGKTLLDGLRGYAEQNNVQLEGLPEDPKVDIPPEQIMTVLRSALAMFFSSAGSRCCRVAGGGIPISRSGLTSSLSLIAGYAGTRSHLRECVVMRSHGLPNRSPFTSIHAISLSLLLKSISLSSFGR
jgi:phospholipase C